MAFSTALDFDHFRQRLSAREYFLNAAGELLALLQRGSTPSLLDSNPEELISLFEVAKGTLKDSGISLHTFSSCPDSLIPYKTIYFNLLQQLQRLCHKAKPSSDYLQVRLARLLFPLSTQLRVSTKSPIVTSGSRGLQKPVSVVAPAKSTPKNGSPHPSTLSSKNLPLPRGKALRLIHLERTPTISPDSMLPPPAPLHRQGYLENSVAIPEAPQQSSAPGPLYYALMESLRGAEYDSRSTRSHPEYKRRRLESRSTSKDKEHGRQNRIDYTSKSPHCIRLYTRHYESDESDTSGSDSDENEDEDTDSEQDRFTAENRVLRENAREKDDPIVIPCQSPLKRSFGIFCTGKGKGMQHSGNVKHFNHHQARLRIST